MTNIKKKHSWPWLFAAPALALPLVAALGVLWLRYGTWLQEAVTAALKVVLIP